MSQHKTAHWDNRGNLCRAEVEQFCVGTNGYIKQWYDQSGNIRHETQSDTAKQSLIVSNGSLNVLNGKPAIRFDKTNSNSLSAAAFDNTKFSIISVRSIVSNPAEGNVYAAVATDGVFVAGSVHYNVRSTRVSELSVSGYTGNVTGTIAPALNTVYSDCIIDNDGVVNIYNNNAVSATATKTAGVTKRLSNFSVGQWSNARYADINLCELILFAVNISDTDKNAIYANHKAYFGIAA